MAFFFLAGVLLLAHAAVLIGRGRAGAAAEAISTRSAGEEVKEEMRELQER
jgi:hypothetical protein